MTFGGSVNLCDGDHWNFGASVAVDGDSHDINVQGTHSCNDDLMLFAKYNIAVPRSDHSCLAIGASVKHNGWLTNLQASLMLPYASKEGTEEKLHTFSGFNGMPMFL